MSHPRLTAERWARLEPLIDAALELPSEIRSRYLERVCAGDPSLRADLERLLAESERSDSLIDTAAAERFSLLLDEGLGELPGVLGDRFDVEREIGRGGMATVFLARDRKHDRPVAVKVLRPDIAAGIGSDRFLREIRTAAGLQHPPAVPAPAVDGRRRIAFGLLVPVALGVGILTGLVGIGGGFLAVPALVLLAKVPMNEAVGTSLLVIAMNSAAGLAGYVEQLTLPWKFIGGFTAVTVIGILAGTYIVRFISPKRLKQAFAVFLLLMGGFVLYQNRAAFDPETAGALHPGDTSAQYSCKQ